MKPGRERIDKSVEAAGSRVAATNLPNGLAVKHAACVVLLEKTMRRRKQREGGSGTSRPALVLFADGAD
jgi:hypothetical protein